MATYQFKMERDPDPDITLSATMGLQEWKVIKEGLKMDGYHAKTSEFLRWIGDAITAMEQTYDVVAE